MCHANAFSDVISNIRNNIMSLQEEAVKLLPKPLQMFGPLSRLLARHIIHQFAAKWKDIDQAATLEKVCRCSKLFAAAAGMPWT